MELFVRPSSGELIAPRLYQHDKNVDLYVTGINRSLATSSSYGDPVFELYDVGGRLYTVPAEYSRNSGGWIAKIPPAALNEIGVIKVYLVLPPNEESALQCFKTILSAEVPVCPRRPAAPAVAYQDTLYR